MKNNSYGLFLGTLLWVVAATLAGPTLAAGGAHIVDDSEVETPGTCHLELWVSRFVPGDGYAKCGARLHGPESSLAPVRRELPALLG